MEAERLMVYAYLVVLVETSYVRDAVRPVEKELVRECHQDVIACQSCVARPVVGREAHWSVEGEVLARREYWDQDAIVEKEELE